MTTDTLTREQRLADLDQRNDALNGDGWRCHYGVIHPYTQGACDCLDPTAVIAPIELRAAIEGVHRTIKKGVKIEFLFGDIDPAVVARIFGQVGKLVRVSIQFEAEQPELPLE